MSKGNILLSLSTGRPRFFKKDKELTAETQDKNRMAADSGSYNKCLIPTSCLRSWDKAITGLRSRFYELTSPYDDSGYRICTPDAFWKFQREYTESQQILMNSKDEFISGYGDTIDQQRTRLGDAFHLSDFPSIDEIEGKFKLEINVAEIPKKGALFHLGEAEEEQLIKKTEERMDASHRNNYQRLFKVVNHLATTLSDGDKTKHCKSTTLTNAQDLAEVIPDINFKDDPILNQLAEQTQQLLSSVSMTDLKKDDEARKRVAAGATETSQHIESMFALYA